MTIAFETITELPVFDVNGGDYLPSDIVPLLEQLIELGSIGGAARAHGLSYPARDEAGKSDTSHQI